MAENNLISATAAYAKDRWRCGRLLSNTLDKYGISIQSAATGTIGTAPVIPGLTTPKAPEAPKPIRWSALRYRRSARSSSGW